MINLLANDSAANLYVMPSAEKSEVMAIVDRWNYPIDPLQIRNNNFLKFILEKEIHVKKSTEGFQCSDLPEQNYYKVRLSLQRKSVTVTPSGTAKKCQCKQMAYIVSL